MSVNFGHAAARCVRSASSSPPAISRWASPLPARSRSPTGKQPNPSTTSECCPSTAGRCAPHSASTCRPRLLPRSRTTSSSYVRAWRMHRPRRSSSSAMRGLIAGGSLRPATGRVLAEAGLLDGRRATTHWIRAGELRARYPNVRVEEDRIFVADGPVSTSAGMTAGIDLALALIEEDLSLEAARTVPRRLVLYHRRGTEGRRTLPQSNEEAIMAPIWPVPAALT